MAPASVRVLYSFLRMPALVTGFAVEMRERLGWEPVYCLTEPETDALIAETFPDAVRHPFADASRAIPPRGLEDLVLNPLSADDLIAARPWEALALEILDRWVLLDAMSQGERRAFHLRLLAWAFAVIDRFEVDLLVLPATPHRVADLALYIACRVRGRQARISSVIGLDGRYIVLDDVDSPPAGLAEAVTRLEPMDDAELPVSEHGRGAVVAAGDVATFTTPWYMQQQHERAAKRHDHYATAEYLVSRRLASWRDARFGVPVEVSIRRVMGLARAISGSGLGTLRTAFERLRGGTRIGRASAFGRGTGSRKPVSPMFLAPGRKLQDRPPTTAAMAHYRDWALLFKTRLKRRYDELSRPMREDHDDAPFVYFPLHYQPERTTTPDGGPFGDQFLAASILANALPPGWRLLIKEHPTTFAWELLGEKGRWDGYYERFLELPRTAFVPIEVPSQQLIAASRAVATITGTAGWEALQLGKPAIAFGNAWWALCRGAHRVGSVAEATAALASVESDDAPTRHDVLAFAAAIESVSARAYTLRRYAGPAEDLTDDEASAALVELFVGTEQRIRARGPVG